MNRGTATQYRQPEERPFRPAERGRTTMLFGGLTKRHDLLIGASMQGVGYRTKPLPTPTKADFQTGREYGNNGMCNPAYFTAGALINYLKGLRDAQGLSTERILEDYLLATAGSCGPCRFGMYEAEYRNALRNSGFDGFRVMTFQPTGGLDQSRENDGLEVTLLFALALLNSIAIADLVNEVAYHIRPYEVVPGQTDKVFERVTERLAEFLREKRYDGYANRPWVKAIGKLLPGMAAHQAGLLLGQLFDDSVAAVFSECAAMIDGMEVDYLRPKPICKIIGEFWAQTTEGDGNFNMFHFLESQGTEVLVEPIMTWIAYLLAHEHFTFREEELLENGHSSPGRGFTGRLRNRLRYQLRLIQFQAVSAMLRREYDRFRKALGGTAHPQVDQAELRRLGETYYNPRCSGGESYLEIAKTIYYTQNHLAHIILSLKPFNCMPSTQSDGAQAAVTAHYPDVLFIPVETSGEGDVHAYSRVQMALGEAKNRCKEEFKTCLAKTGRTPDELRDYCAKHPELRRPLQQIPRHDGVVGRAANFALYVASIMDRERT